MSRNRVSIILALMQLRRREEIVLPVFSPEWQQEALSVLWGTDRWISQEISLEQRLSEMSVIAAEGTSKRESDTSTKQNFCLRMSGSSRTSCAILDWQVGCLERPGQLKCEHVRSLPESFPRLYVLYPLFYFRVQLRIFQRLKVYQR